MKLIGFFIFIIISLANCTMKSSTNISTGTTFDQSGPKLYVKYAKMLTCAQKPLETSCPKCVAQTNGFSLFFFYQTSRLRQYHYKFMIHYNDEERKVVVTFAGPSVKANPRYVQLIYSQGFRWVREYSVQVESEYHTVYYKQLRKLLISKISKVLHSGRSHYQFIFTGHSIGGSLATLASYDLHHSELLNRERNHTQVYTFGGLRIGDRRLVTLVNTSVTLFRIIRNDDYIVRIPNCYYLNGWGCYTRSVINNYISVHTSPLFFYLQNYRYSSYYTISAYSAIHTWSISYRRTSFLEVSSEKSRRSKRQFTRVMTPEEEEEELKKKKDLLRKKKLEEQLRHTNRQIRNVRNAHLGHHSFGSQNTFGHNLASNAHREHLEKLQNEKRRREQEHLARLSRENTRYEHERRRRQHEQMATAFKTLPKPQNKTLIVKKSIPIVNSNLKLISPQIVQLPKLQMTPQVAKTYYYTNVYYTQPYGQLIYYNTGFVSYQVCPYVHFVSVCERRIVLPATFVITPHYTYYEENFDVCDA